MLPLTMTECCQSLPAPAAATKCHVAAADAIAWLCSISYDSPLNMFWCHAASRVPKLQTQKEEE